MAGLVVGAGGEGRIGHDLAGIVGADASRLPVLVGVVAEMLLGGASRFVLAKAAHRGPDGLQREDHHQEEDEKAAHGGEA
ncbi:hypothetical protein [Oryzomicrobium sp.]|uniref:hypothetical protein n=1 Tax=Oryzomicrobium sp. TaxID=1911578 RepID=UPI0025CDF1A8|nr:hypothetical protein [Oryzomicrobium sp.]MCE1242346.1 hypothetical protein [Oryzomicrobium sp.]